MTVANKSTNEILPPPTERSNLLGWIYKNLFNSWFNSLLTVLTSTLIFVVVRGVITWAFGPEASWQVIPNNFRLFFVGQYPSQIEGQTDFLWRIWLCVYLLALTGGLVWGTQSKGRQNTAIGLVIGTFVLAFVPYFYSTLTLPEEFTTLSTSDALATAWDISLFAIIGIAAFMIGRWRQESLKRVAIWMLILYFPLIVFIILGFGEEFMDSGAPFGTVPTRFWGGLLLSLLLAVIGIVVSFPIGVTFALWRQSKLPVMRTIAVAYIELIRGVPLISLLFMGQVMLPLFLPDTVTIGSQQFAIQIDRVVRAMIAITLFSGAYLAENIRGGLQAIPNGQYEAAHALGLSNFQTMYRIILPQAIRTVIPVMVSQFIGLFKDTTLVAIVGLFDLLGMSRSIMGNPSYIGTQREVFLFISVFYFVFSYALSSSSRRLEAALSQSR